MNIDWMAFTPGSSLAGGLLIGTAAALLLAGAGRIAGIAGIVGSLLQSPRDAARWAFVAGLMAAPWIWQAVAPLPAREATPTSWTLLALAGLIVGVGVRWGSGCTSGHGVCGLSRGSQRSLANVLAFMGSGFITVALIRHVFA